MSDSVNVLVVVIECARTDRVSCFGYGRETTPFLDEVAREGVRFPQMIATASWAMPSVASLLTGLYPVTHGATDENRFLSGRHTTLPEALKASGYRTAAFCVNPWISPETGFGRGFDAYFTQRHHNRLAARALLYGRQAGDRLLRRRDSGARRTNHAFHNWLDGGTQPFFALIHYNETHLPLQPPPPYDRMFLPKAVERARTVAVSQDASTWVAGQGEISADDVTILHAHYDGALRYVDTRLREVAEVLRARGEWERTLLVVTGDNGEHLGEHGRIGHGFALSDSVLRVPLLMRCPDRVPRGYVIDQLAQTTDIAPTILQLLHLPVDSVGPHGRSLIVDGHATGGPPFAIAEQFRPNLSAYQHRFPDIDTRPYEVRKKAIRTTREKFIWHSDEANEFYDLVADPGERYNVVEREPARADALRRQLFDWLAGVDKYEAAEDVPELDGLMRRQLNGMGYIY